VIVRGRRQTTSSRADSPYTHKSIVLNSSSQRKLLMAANHVEPVINGKDNLWHDVSILPAPETQLSVSSTRYDPGDRQLTTQGGQWSNMRLGT
jgi:hypothetical protein